MMVGVGEDAGRGERQASLELDDDQNGELDIGAGFEVEGHYIRKTHNVNIKYNLFIFSEHYIRKTLKN